MAMANASFADIRDGWDMEIQRRLLKYESEVRKKPNDRKCMIDLGRFCAQEGAPYEGIKHLRRAAVGISGDDDVVMLNLHLGNAYVAVWKALWMGYDGEMEVNIKTERATMIVQAVQCFDEIVDEDEIWNNPKFLAQVAYGKECKGDLKSCLELYSEIISEHTDYEGQPAVIFKAAILLHHVGQDKQAKRYLEYLTELDSEQTGVSGVHFFAAMAGVYDDFGLEELTTKSYEKMQDAYLHERNEAQEIVGKHIKLVKQMSPEEFRKFGGIWEELAMEAVQSSNYILAIQFLVETISRKPSVNLLLLLAECLHLMGEKERALVTAEQAYTLDQNHTRLQKRLMEWDPDKWEKELGEQVKEALEKEEANKPAPKYVKRKRRKKPKIPNLDLFNEVDGDVKLVQKTYKKYLTNKWGYEFPHPTYKLLATFKKNEPDYINRNNEVLDKKRADQNMKFLHANLTK